MTSGEHRHGLEERAGGRVVEQVGEHHHQRPLGAARRGGRRARSRCRRSLGLEVVRARRTTARAGTARGATLARAWRRRRPRHRSGRPPRRPPRRRRPRRRARRRGGCRSPIGAAIRRPASTRHTHVALGVLAVLVAHRAPEAVGGAPVDLADVVVGSVVADRSRTRCRGRAARGRCARVAEPARSAPACARRRASGRSGYTEHLVARRPRCGPGGRGAAVRSTRTADRRQDVPAATAARRARRRGHRPPRPARSPRRPAAAGGPGPARPVRPRPRPERRRARRGPRRPAPRGRRAAGAARSDQSTAVTIATTATRPSATGNDTTSTDRPARASSTATRARRAHAPATASRHRGTGTSCSASPPRRRAGSARARPRAAAPGGGAARARPPRLTSSGVTKSRPARRAAAFDAASRCTAARGLAPTRDARQLAGRPHDAQRGRPRPRA